MPDWSANTWLLVVIALLALLLAVWRIFAGVRRTRVEFERTSAEGPARRNQALIDAPAAPPVPGPPPAPPPHMPPPTPDGLAGIGEVIAAAAEPEPIVAALTEFDGEDDDLTRIKGLGPRIAEQLQALGVTRFAQIAAWNEAEIDRIDAQLGRFAGRIRRDDWPGQARLLAEGDTPGYEARFGKL
ncbi:MAG: hypothetical protein B7Z08_10910 [Sphingomonadales bacterium 32-68-7]|nr:MAG: hypothetical protein B7Z33_10855 [Sphingomonadales bacterium 12-68-11]OYX08082.1 MAG: hypothetical protein B7Z08_10910 [Sphingomonadales bacterium 32-68-7]